MKKYNHERDERNEKEAGSKISSFVLFVSFVVKKHFFSSLLFFCASAPLREPPIAQAQESGAVKPAASLPLDQFQPRSMLVLPEQRPAGAKFPAVDVHVHCRHKLRQSPEALAEYVRLMDNQNIAISVSLDGELGEQLEEHKKFLWTKYPDRFVIFANINWQGDGKTDEPATWDCQRADFARRMAAALADAKLRGASGLKIFKDLGLVYRNPDGSLIAIDDPRWDLIWTACGELGLPILIHAGDPAAFFQPLDRFNERYEELSRHPDWHFPADKFPCHAEILASFLRVVERHPKTIFIGAHLANNPENLAELGGWLDKYPNLNIELAARIAEIGRQPRAAREFCLKYADRILFGTDGPRDVKRLAPHWRLLETADEYFPYAEDQYPPQGFWNIYGLDLPDDVLRQIYNENASRLIPGVKERLPK